MSFINYSWEKLRNLTDSKHPTLRLKTQLLNECMPIVGGAWVSACVEHGLSGCMHTWLLSECDWL